MDKKNLEPLSKKSQNDLMRKKLEAELRATEEIARIKQSVIEKRLAVELASLEQEQVAQEQEKSGDGKTDESRPSEEHPVGKKTSKVPVSPGEAEEGNRRWLKKFVTSSAKAESKEITADAATYSAFLDVPLKKSPFCGNRSVVATKHPIPITPMPEFFKALPVRGTLPTSF
ncbi:UNVERIFIED_CONTAM: hypothetical protein PYX00_008625 [Menopon gallinae]|uniref:Uncharacterized protein n=1 Tax=Menopon gallinae TaxID=328185 RepID=A0AAW2HP46_9NEOP